MPVRSRVRPYAVKLLLQANSIVGVAHLKLVPASALNEQWFSQVAYFSRLLDRVENVDGDVVECGVGTGKSLAIIANLAHGRRIWGFDSWQGLPEPSSEDQGGVAEKGMFLEASIGEVRLRLQQFGWQRFENLTLIDGQFAQTLPATPLLERIAFLHLDVDLYQSYKFCLENLWAKVQSGGIVALDEYANPAWPGATKAVDEFIETLPSNGAELQRDHRFYNHHFLVKH